MKGIGHIEAVPPAIDAVKEDILRLRQNTCRIQHEGKRNTGPFRDCRPALLANVLGNLGPDGKRFNSAREKS